MVSIDSATYDVQIISYDANLSFFYRWIYNLRDYPKYKVIINVFFALNLKLCKILRFTIRSYDLRFRLLSTILYKIPIMTTLNSWVISLKDWISLYFASALPFSLKCVRHAQVASQRKSKMTFMACSIASFNEVSCKMWAGLQWCHAPNIVNRHRIWLINNLV